MARAYSRKDWPHRILFDTGANAQRGDDVKVLRRHTAARLQARDIQRNLGSADGTYNKQLASAAKTAAHFLGVPQEWTDSKSGLLVREQKVIVHPETRTASMLNAARTRMDKLQKDREAHDDDRPGGPSGLGEKDRVEARRIAVAAMALLYQHRAAVHYTQGGSRWQGIAEKRRYADGRFPLYCDCSSSTSWALWNALTSVGGLRFADIVNGAAWKAGYTGTMLSHGKLVTSRMPGDLVLYGSGFPGKHVAMVASNTDYVYSHGSEAGPYYLAWNYRGDVMQVRRYV
jgi:hypothetical protein